MKLIVFLLLCVTPLTSIAALTIYTDRPVARFLNAQKIFESQTGEKLQFAEASYSDLLKRLITEGKNTPADLIITKDLVYLAELQTKGLLKPLEKSAMVNQVYSFMRADDLSWVGLTFRARTAAYDPSRVDPAELTTYEDLAQPKWTGRLCLRTSKSTYNEALGAQLILSHGLSQARSILKAWIENLAQPVIGSDTLLLEEIAKGNCDVGIVNHYYLASLLAQKPNFPVRLAFLNQQSGGVHTNGTGVGLIRHSSHAQLAQKFVEILLSDAIQTEISAAHFDYPAVKHLAPTTLIKDWGRFKMESTPWSEIGKRAQEARILMDEIGYK